MTGQATAPRGVKVLRSSTFRSFVDYLRARGETVADRLGLIDQALVDPSTCCWWVDDPAIGKTDAWTPSSV